VWEPLAQNSERNDRARVNLELVRLLGQPLIQFFNVSGTLDEDAGIWRERIVTLATPFTLMQPADPSIIRGLEPNHSPQLLLWDTYLLLLGIGEIKNGPASFSIRMFFRNENTKRFITWLARIAVFLIQYILQRIERYVHETRSRVRPLENPFSFLLPQISPFCRMLTRFSNAE
jgi:hypothetical protein